MKSYELLLVLSAILDETAREALLEKVKVYLEAVGATLQKVDKWGIKKFAYPIRYQNEGFYVVYDLSAPANLVKSVEPKLRIEENIMRVIFTAK